MADFTLADTETRAQTTVGSSPRSSFDINFPFFALTDIKVSVAGVPLTYGADFTIDGTSVSGRGFTSGTLTLLSAVSDTTVEFWREIPNDRTQALPSSGGLNITALNQQLDRLTAQMQDLRRQLGLSVRFPDDVFDIDLVEITETAASRASKVLGFSADGRTLLPIANGSGAPGDGSDPSKVPLSRSINTTGGLQGGGTLASDRSLSIATTGVVAGTYPYATITVNARGQVTEVTSNEVGAGGETGVPATRSITTSSPLVGGGTLSADRTISLAASGVTASTYAYPSAISVDTFGRVTGMSGGFAPAPATRSISAGTGLSGGGTLEADRSLSLQASGVTAGSYANPTVTVDAYGRVTSVAAGTSNGIGWFNVKDYGAAGDGVTDDLAAFNAAIAAIPSTGGVLYIPAGTYALTGKVSISGKPILLQGAGMEISILKWSSLSQGVEIDVSGGTNGLMAIARDFTLMTSYAGVSGTGLKITGAHTSGQVDPSVYVERLQAIGASTSAMWSVFAHLIECPQAKIIGNQVDGADGAGAAMDVAIKIESFNQATSYEIVGNELYWCKIGVAVVGGGVGTTPEGFYVAHNAFVACNRGFDGSGVSDAMEGLQFFKNHLACKDFGLIGYFNQSVITGNLFYDRPGSSAASAMCFFQSSASASIGLVVNGNIFVNAYGTTINCLVVGETGGSGVSGVIITANMFQYSSTGGFAIALRNDVTQVSLVENRVTGGGNYLSNAATAVSSVSGRGASQRRTAGAVSVTNSVETLVNWLNEITKDTDGITTTAGRLTVPNGVRKVKVDAFVPCGSGSGDRYFSVKHYSSAGSLYTPGVVAGDSANQATLMSGQSGVINVADGDYFQLYVWQNSGGSLNFSNGLSFSMEVVE